MEYHGLALEIYLFSRFLKNKALDPQEKRFRALLQSTLTQEYLDIFCSHCILEVHV